jgi:hypothetical protein
VARAQYRARDTEWPSYAADLAGTHYRPLDQINAANFSDLEIAWRIKTDNFGNRPEYKLEGTPLMVNSVLYATAGSRRAVIALDAATGELLWVHGEHEGARGGAWFGVLVRRKGRTNSLCDTGLPACLPECENRRASGVLRQRRRTRFEA